jgi:23S rRNA (cytidine1920-2'-O)/16S rRNA (cytidine1409-2'-O)-methyltransferase
LKKIRIDRLLLDRGLAESREKARALIMAGDVLVGDRPVLKAGTEVAGHSPVRLRRPPHPYVSRGGVKLGGALADFGIAVGGRTAADIGASTGGFTDCLLQSGARKVFAIDVDPEQLDWRLAEDERVRKIAGNARYLEPGWLDEPVDLVTIDVSFISLSLILPPAARLLAVGGEIVALVKPQFEVGRAQVGKGGIVRDPTLQAGAVAGVLELARSLGLSVRGSMPSPITGKMGNQEFFVWLERAG